MVRIQTAKRGEPCTEASEHAPLSLISRKVFEICRPMNRRITPEGPISFQRRLPIELESHFQKTSRGPKHFNGPPGFDPDITQIEKIRQCKFALRRLVLVGQRNQCLESSRAAQQKQDVCKNLLASRKTCDIFAPFWIPHCEWREVRCAPWGTLRDKTGGGSA